MTDASLKLIRDEKEKIVKVITVQLESRNLTVRASSVETLVGFTKDSKFAVPFKLCFHTELFKIPCGWL
jgi:uncharacterized protein YlaN (UPF0358 family)